MDMVTLSTAKRATEVSARQLRRGGNVPCVVYGNTKNQTFQCDEIAILKAYTKAGESTLVELDLEGKKLPVLFHEVSFDPVTDRIAHVDFFAVDMNKEVEADVPVHFEGESLAVKEAGAILVTALDAVTVKCLPKNLPHNLSLDLSKLVEMGSTLTVADLAIPQHVTIVTPMDTVIVIAQQPREEEVEEVAPVADAAAAVDAEGNPIPPAEGDAAAASAEGAAKAEKKE